METKTEQKNVEQCVTCGLLYEASMTADSRKYKDKYYCQIHWEDAIRKDDGLTKCIKCSSEVNSSFMQIYHGSKICPLCFAIQQHDDIVNASKAYRKKLESVKKQLVPMRKLPESNKRRLTNKNWMDVAYKSKSKK